MLKMTTYLPAASWRTRANISMQQCLSRWKKLRNGGIDKIFIPPWQPSIWYRISELCGPMHGHVSVARSLLSNGDYKTEKHFVIWLTKPTTPSSTGSTISSSYCLAMLESHLSKRSLAYFELLQIVPQWKVLHSKQALWCKSYFFKNQAKKIKAKDHVTHLKRRLDLWKEGNISSLV